VRQALFVQGAGEDVDDAWDAKLVESLRRELGPQYEIHCPRMPNEGNPEYGSWRSALEREIDALRAGAVIVGHSVGGAILIHALAERLPDVALGAIVLIAAPFLGPGGCTPAPFRAPACAGCPGAIINSATTCRRSRATFVRSTHRPAVTPRRRNTRCKTHTVAMPRS
jgi:pimeloyl-ACP methyl ester carboxylesterase